MDKIDSVALPFLNNSQLPPLFGYGIFRTHLRTDRTAYTLRLINFDCFSVEIESRAGDFIDTIAVIFAFRGYRESPRLELFQALGIQGKGFEDRQGYNV